MPSADANTLECLLDRLRIADHLHGDVRTAPGSFPVASIQLVDIYGNVNTFNLVHVQLNKGIGDEIFVP